MAIPRRRALRTLAGAWAGSSLSSLASPPLFATEPAPPHDRAGWMSRGSYGLMVHWIAPGPAPRKGPRVTDLNKAVDAFDLEGLLGDFRRTGADWLIFTIGQNTACYASPNAALDGWAGPGHCSRRDLVLETARALHAMGKRFVGYLPSEVDAPKALHAAFAWNPKNQSEFQKRYTTFVREYAARYGRDLDGWWFDGCYTWEVFPNSTYDWPLWAGAARAGNPDAALAFNDGSFCVGQTQPLTPQQDYLSGEVEVLRQGKVRLGRGDDSPLILPSSRFALGTRCQWHALVPIDCPWAHEGPGLIDPPRYPDEELFGFVKSAKSVGGAVTLNAGIYQEGRLAEATLGQLERLSKALGTLAVRGGD